MTDSTYFNHRPEEWRPLLHEVIENGYRDECFIWPGGVSKKGTQYPVRDEHGEGRWPGHLVLEATVGPKPGDNFVMRYDPDVCPTGHPCVRPGHFAWVDRTNLDPSKIDSSIDYVLNHAVSMQVYKANKPRNIKYRTWSAVLTAKEEAGQINIVRKGPGTLVWFIKLDEA